MQYHYGAGKFRSGRQPTFRGTGSGRQSTIRGSHAVSSWLVEDAADLILKYSVGADGRTPYQRWKGKKVSHEAAEIVEKVHFKINKKGRPRGEKLEVKWKSGRRATSSAIIGGGERLRAESGVTRAATIRRVGPHLPMGCRGSDRENGVGRGIGTHTKDTDEGSFVLGCSPMRESPRASRRCLGMKRRFTAWRCGRMITWRMGSPSRALGVRRSCWGAPGKLTQKLSPTHRSVRHACSQSRVGTE